VAGHTGPGGPGGYQGRQGSAGYQGPQGSSGGSTISSGTSSISGIRVGSPTAPVNGDVGASGSITAGYSDKRLKHQIEIIPDAIKKIKAITGIFYVRNDVAKSYNIGDDKRQIGLIAQQVEEVAPELIDKAPFNRKYFTVNYDKVTALLLQGIKEQQEQINILNKAIEDES
tara:strand:+ start:1577 stop:2089 length:513 start_codon:yes stop_codon:yes gene_type:complete